MYRLKWVAVSLLLTALIASMGCGGRNESKGRVTLDGSPVAGAGLFFYPVTAGQGVICTGSSDSEGMFSVTPTTGQVVTPGEYTVTVTKTEMSGSVGDTPLSPDNDGESDAQERRRVKGMVEGKPPPVERNVLPDVYGDAKTSPLKVTIPSGGDKNLKIELKKS